MLEKRARQYWSTFDRLASTGPSSHAGLAPLGVLIGDDECFDWQRDCRRQHEADAVIYETHVGVLPRANEGAEIRR